MSYLLVEGPEWEVKRRLGSGERRRGRGKAWHLMGNIPGRSSQKYLILAQKLLISHSWAHPNQKLEMIKILHTRATHKIWKIWKSFTHKERTKIGKIKFRLHTGNQTTKVWWSQTKSALVFAVDGAPTEMKKSNYPQPTGEPVRNWNRK